MIRLRCRPSGMEEPVALTIDTRNQFDTALQSSSQEPLYSSRIDTIQVNIGLTCNLACHHCHVKSGPKREEQMSWETLQLVIRAAKRAQVNVIDITGGAPEMNPFFKQFIQEARASGFEVMVRTNLTIMLLKGYEDLPQFYRDHQVHLVASLPCYLPLNVDKQRGEHVYQDSIKVLLQLNAVGFGIDSALPLDLVYNPIDHSLPPQQIELEIAYRNELERRFNIHFTRLLTMTNMPIGRFKESLRKSGRASEYYETLTNTFNPDTIPELMCRRQIHVSHDGTLHDCDFNYAIGIPIGFDAPNHIRDFDSRTLQKRRIVTGDHCLGCTAGSGSSCGGALS